ncbi:MAG: acyl-CoA reductase [Flavobacteriales bacterium]|nr:acyl-CoA reductase [Flavobacteriales bacterium]
MKGLQMQQAALAKLGEVMRSLGAGAPWPGHGIGLAESEYATLDDSIRRARQHNGWSTEEEVRHAFRAWGEALEADSIAQWTDGYPALLEPRQQPRTVGLILAGNVPLVGLHDVISVWLSGHNARIKCSSQEPDLIPALVRVLDHFLPGTGARFVFVQDRLGEVEAVVATGSNNTARHFEHYFRHLPRIVRKNRVSVAVLTGQETEEELAALGDDVFRYFGLGCRNVSKLLLPRDFDVDRVFKAFFPWKDIIHHNKYANNYDYTRALWLLDRVPFLENGFLLLKEDAALASPVTALFYERYDDIREADAFIAEHRDRIQCVVGREQEVGFGRAQHPALWDYADGTDTMSFLLEMD